MFVNSYEDDLIDEDMIIFILQDTNCIEKGMQKLSNFQEEAQIRRFAPSELEEEFKASDLALELEKSLSVYDEKGQESITLQPQDIIDKFVSFKMER